MVDYQGVAAVVQPENIAAMSSVVWDRIDRGFVLGMLGPDDRNDDGG